MPTLSRYLLRRILPPFVFALIVVLFALSLERLLRLVQTVTDQGAPVGKALGILSYLVPHYLGLAVPAALFLAVLLALRHLYTSFELSAVFNAGVPLARLLRPIAGLALVLGAFLLVNAGYVQPHARYAYRASLHEVTEATLAFRLQPGTFNRVHERMVLRADAVGEGGRLLGRFFAEVETPEGGRSVITAREARVLSRAKDGALVVRLRDGTIVHEDGGAGAAGAAGSIEFEEYTWEPPLDLAAPYGPRGHGERELTLDELIAGGMPGRPANASPAEIRTELHARLVRAASMPVLAVLAVPLALLGSGRTGRAYGLVLGIALLVLYEKVLGFAEAFAADGAVPAWIGLWVPFAGLAALTWVLMHHASEAHGRRLRLWLLGRSAPRRPATGIAAE